MEFISDFAQGFMALFQAGGETFVGWVTWIIPMVICLMTAIHSIIKLIYDCALYRCTGAGSAVSGKPDVLYLWALRGRKIQACIL